MAAEGAGMVKEEEDLVTKKGMRPRMYQRELFEEARKRNVVAFLDTGAGKTLISVLLIKDKAEAAAAACVKKVTVFLAPKVDLVLQQAGVLREHTGLETGAFVGSMGVDFWKEKEWQVQFREKQVMVMTHQILLNCLRHNFLKMQDINLLVFDECHHTKKNHPYNCIMREFYFDKSWKGERPHIFGMTASPLDTKIGQDTSKISSFFEELEANLDARVLTIADRSQLEAAAPLPNQVVLMYSTPPPSAALQAALDQLRAIEMQLRVAAADVRWAWQKNMLDMEGLSKLGLVFDEEKQTTECGTFARSIGNIAYVFQELGAFAAVICLSEVLKPAAHSIYTARLRGMRLEAVKAQAARAVDEDLDLFDDQDDDWWDGKPVFGSNSRQPCKRNEVDNLRAAMEEVVAVFQGLLVPDAPPPGIPEADASFMTWPEICERLRRNVDGLMAAVDLDALGKQLMHTSNEPADGRALLVSAKATTLCQHLMEYKAKAEGGDLQQVAGEGPTKHWSCIIFTKRKFTALALNWMINQCPSLSFLCSAPIMGYSRRASGAAVSWKAQQKVLASFRANALNTLVATSVAEEGLDLTQCALVVRFDLPDTPLEFIQSRGRARARNSSMVLMLAAGNAAQAALLDDVRGCEETMRAEAMRRRCSAEESGDSDAEAMWEEQLADGAHEGDEWEYRVPATGAKVTVSNAKQLLFHYCNKLPSDKYSGKLRPRFSTQALQDSRYQTVAVLPNNCPVHRAEGTPQANKSGATATACLAAIKLIHQAGGLTDHLLPDVGIPSSTKDAFAQLDDYAVTAAPRAPDMPARAILRPKRPKVLSGLDSTDGRPASQGTAALRLMYLYRYNLASQRDIRHKKAHELEQPLGLLMPQRMPELPTVPMQLIAGLVADVTLEYLGPRRLTAEEHTAAKKWHEVVCAQSRSKGAPSPVPKPSSASKPSSKKRQGDSLDESPAERPEPKRRKASVQRPKSTSGKLHHVQTGRAQHGEAEPHSQPALVGAKRAATAVSPCCPVEPETAGSRNLTSRGVGQEPGGEVATAAQGGAVAGSEGSNQAGSLLASSNGYNRDIVMEDSNALGRELACDDPCASPRGPDAAAKCAPTCPDALADLPSPQPGESSGGRAAGQREEAGNGQGHEELFLCLVPLALASGESGIGPSGEEAQAWVVDWTAVKQAGHGSTALDWQHRDLDELAAELKGMVVTTIYNQLSYQFLRIRRDVATNSAFPTDTESEGGVPNLKVEEDGTLRSSNAQDVGEGLNKPAAVKQEPMTYAGYYSSRWGIKELLPASFMLECTSKELQRRREHRDGVEVGLEDIKVLLIPQLCVLHPLRKEAYQTSKFVPRLLWWVHILLTAAELRDWLSSKQPDMVRPPLMMVAEALMPRGCLHNFCCERLENLGDAYLKYNTSLHCFYAYPKAHEGQLAAHKQKVISNANLALLGHHLGLAAYITLPCDAFSWADGTAKERDVPHKVVADCVEALIGAYYTAGGDGAASLFMRAIGLLPPMPPGVGALPPKSAKQASPFARKLEAVLNYEFRSTELMKEACTHCSWPDQGAPFYQRLEFLGDAVIDLFITRFYLVNYRDAEPGKVHDVRSATVNNTRLAAIAAWYRLHPFLRYFSPALFGEIASFVDSVREARKKGFKRKITRDFDAQFAVRRYKPADSSTSRGPTLSTWATDVTPAPPVVPGRAPSRDAAGASATPATAHRAVPPPPGPPPPSAHAARQRTERGRKQHGGREHPPEARAAGRATAALPRPVRREKKERQAVGCGSPEEAEGDLKAKQDAVDSIISAGFGLGMAAAPKVLADLLEALIGAVFVDSGCSLEVTWKVLEPLMQPMVHPDKVPIHPVRAILELAQSCGLTATFRKEPCEELGCVSMSTVIAGKIVGFCESAATRDYARLLCAEDALNRWSDELVLELRTRTAAQAKAQDSAQAKARAGVSVTIQESGGSADVQRAADGARPAVKEEEDEEPPLHRWGPDLRAQLSARLALEAEMQIEERTCNGGLGRDSKDTDEPADGSSIVSVAEEHGNEDSKMADCGLTNELDAKRQRGSAERNSVSANQAECQLEQVAQPPCSMPLPNAAAPITAANSKLDAQRTVQEGSRSAEQSGASYPAQHGALRVQAGREGRDHDSEAAQTSSSTPSVLAASEAAPVIGKSNTSAQVVKATRAFQPATGTALSKQAAQPGALKIPKEWLGRMRGGKK